MSKKLLLADDSITIQKVIGITFANGDYDLTVVGDGDTALEKARTERPDLILADVFMPGKNGYELCAAAKADPSLGGVPVLLLTGTFEPFDEGKAAAAGADGWIAKPFESQVLIDKVEDLLSRSVQSHAESPLVSAVPAAAEPRLGEDIWADLPVLDAAGEEDEPLGIEEAFAPVEERDEGSVPSYPEDDIWQSLGEELPAVADEAPPFAFEAEEELPSPDTFDPFAEESVAAMEDPFASLKEDADAAALHESFSEDTPAQEWMAAAESPEGDASGGASIWESFDDEEILALEEGDILEDDLEIEEDGDLSSIVASMEKESESPPVDLEEEANEIPPAELLWEPAHEETGGEEDFGLSGSASFLDGAAGDFMAAEAADEEDFFELGADDLIETAGIEAPSVFAEEAFAPEDEYAFSLEEKQPLPPEASPVSEEAMAPTLPSLPTSAAVEEKVSSLTEAELERIVEKVAGSVIERLAQTMLERIAWEVVPDLAESMIKDEIRKIREEVQ